VFERGLLERLRYDLAPHGFRVEGTTEMGQHRVLGRHSEARRQLDVAVYYGGAGRPFFIADAKWHDRPLDVADVDAFVGLMDDVGATAGLLAAPHGFSDGARRRAAAADVAVIVMSFDEALRYRWMPMAWEIYQWDAASHHDIARAIQAIADVDLHAAGHPKLSTADAASSRHSLPGVNRVASSLRCSSRWIARSRSLTPTRRSRWRARTATPQPLVRITTSPRPRYNLAEATTD